MKFLKSFNISLFFKLPNSVRLQYVERKNMKTIRIIHSYKPQDQYWNHWTSLYFNPCVKTKAKSVYVCVYITCTRMSQYAILAFTMWTSRLSRSTVYKYKWPSVDSHTAVLCFHEIENLNYLKNMEKGGSFWAIVIIANWS